MLLKRPTYPFLPLFTPKRRNIFRAAIILLLMHGAAECVAQPVIKQRPCESPEIQRQADSIKREFAKNGFIVAKENSVTMESAFEMPVIVPLTQGTWYQVIFIGEKSSKLYELRIFGSDDRKIAAELNRSGDFNGHIISYPFIPQASEYYMIKLLQINKQLKEMCGYVMLLKKTQ